MDQVADLPLLTTPHDALRDGLRTLKEDASISHPVEAVQDKQGRHVVLSREDMLKKVYGSALPAQLAIERQILGRPLRLPGFESSLLGLESMTRELDDFAFESYLGLPMQSETVPVDVHSAMEAKLHMGTKMASRGIL